MATQVLNPPATPAELEAARNAVNLSNARAAFVEFLRRVSGEMPTTQENINAISAHLDSLGLPAERWNETAYLSAYNALKHSGQISLHPPAPRQKTASEIEAETRAEARAAAERKRNSRNDIPSNPRRDNDRAGFVSMADAKKAFGERKAEELRETQYQKELRAAETLIVYNTGTGRNDYAKTPDARRKAVLEVKKKFGKS